MNATDARKSLTIGKRVAWSRRRTGKSQIDFAAAAGMSWRNLVRIENEQVKPRAETLARIAEAAGQPVEFFDADDEEESDPLSLDELLRLRIRQIVREETRA